MDSKLLAAINNKATMQAIGRKLASWRMSFQERERYCTHDRDPFLKIARDYLPLDSTKTVVDVGAGSGLFAHCVDPDKRLNNLYLLDANQSTVQYLKTKFRNVIAYKAPDKLPFANSSVSYIHCSHLIEHLLPDSLYVFLKEIDRVLERGGTVVVSSPLLWCEFYADMSHIKPYNPDVFIHYFCQPKGDRSSEIISDEYSVVKMVYRYTTMSCEGWGSRYAVIDFAFQLMIKAARLLGIRKYIKSGYTLVLNKTNPHIRQLNSDIFG